MFGGFLVGVFFPVLTTEIYFTLECQDSLGCGDSLYNQSVLGVKHDLFELELQFFLVAEGKLLPQCVLFQPVSHWLATN